MLPTTSVSELISVLQEILEEVGDVPVIVMVNEDYYGIDGMTFNNASDNDIINESAVYVELSGVITGDKEVAESED